MDRLFIIWKSDLTDKLKGDFFQVVAVSVLLYGNTTWTLAKRLEYKLDGSCTRILRAALNKSWKQHPTKEQLYGHLPPITQTIREMANKTRRTLLEKRGRAHKQRAPVGPYAWTHQRGSANEDLHRAALRGFWMPRGGPAESDVG